MHAVIQWGSEQFRVSEGDVIDTQIIRDQKNKKLNFEQVLLYEDGTDIRVGQPFIKDVKVSGEIVGDFLADKVISFKYRRRKGSLWKKGHRQKHSSVKITKISAGK